jgi:hypothetical protein
MRPPGAGPAGAWVYSLPTTLAVRQHCERFSCHTGLAGPDPRISIKKLKLLSLSEIFTPVFFPKHKLLI